MKKKMQQPGNIMGLRIDTTGEEKKKHTHTVNLELDQYKDPFWRTKEKDKGNLQKGMKSIETDKCISKHKTA